ncbi:helicase protein [Winkia neuii]|uniref:Helicase n=4 Tax=Actinomycetaceae TaxID=2049 RepID=A0A2I1IQB2_9ACTO|nr:helicase protein [Winkia neuii]OFJ72318.1 helicase [Actinomyces sp. HMSC064C12]OFK02033.1 helicase [Actinomyces sp. HMSC072A03]PKY73309.1 helicase [Winkia neuii]
MGSWTGQVVAMSDKQVTVGDLVFSDIDSNEFLKQLYANLLYNYGLHRLGLVDRHPYDVDFEAALRFADLLSKSTHPTNRDRHRVWAQEIALLCHILYPQDARTKAYVSAIFTTLGNYPGLKQLGVTSDAGILDAAFNAYQAEYLTVPGDKSMKFFAPQKKIYDRLNDGKFSFSAPTSLGKSFIMRTFITNQIKSGVKANFAIIVPSKALINETRSKLIADLGEDLERRNYRIVSAAGDIVLEGDHNFIFVLTPERLLYLLIGKPAIEFEYVFFDESHKLSGKNSRAPFYYQTVTILQHRHRPPHFVFASPNIPNPEVFLRLVDPNSDENETNAVATQYSPVTQFKYLVNLHENTISSYNDHTQEFTHLASLQAQDTTTQGVTRFVSESSRGSDHRGQTIVFHSARHHAVQAARDYAQSLADLNDKDLDDLAKDIERDVHEDYYLSGLIRRGVSYHIGYLPPAIRERIEGLFREGKISTLFCTSTLLEGVNLPADNLVITTNKIGRAGMTAVDFKNLIGRVGRIEFNLYGNVFIIVGDQLASEQKAKELLQANVPAQKLSVQTDSQIISKKMKQGVVKDLQEGRIEFSKGNESYERYDMKRKFGLMLLRDITTGRQSLVREEFSDYLDEQATNSIIATFSRREGQQDDDINVSIDQAEALTHAIQAGLQYPQLSPNGKFSYDETLAFLQRLASIFKWRIYNPETLGRTPKGSDQLAMLSWYTVLLLQWMEGHGLRSIMNRAIEHHRKTGIVWINRQPNRYLDSKEHRNLVFSDTLEAIEQVILFELSNYFLKFSNEYKKVHGKEQFDNDWYEYVEYGTTKQETILLQRLGFTRESATYIRINVSNAIFLHEGKPHLNPILLESSNINVRKEANEIRYNVPEAFSMPLTPSSDTR